jgi:hypothetical protein
MGAGALSSRIKRLELEADNLPAFSAEMQNEWSYTFIRAVRGINLG